MNFWVYKVKKNKAAILKKKTIRWLRGIKRQKQGLWISIQKLLIKDFCMMVDCTVGHHMNISRKNLILGIKRPAHQMFLISCMVVEDSRGYHLSEIKYQGKIIILGLMGIKCLESFITTFWFIVWCYRVLGSIIWLGFFNTIFISFHKKTLASQGPLSTCLM